MNAYVYPSRQERAISGAGTFGMHLLFIALLVFGVNWQKKVEPQANIVELWTNLQPQAKPVEAPPPPPPPPPPPEPEVRPKVQPVEPPKPVAKPEVAKPDIAMKEKAVKDKAVKEKAEKEKAEKEKAEQVKVEKERRALEDKQREAVKREVESQAAQKQQAADAQRMAKEQEDAQRRMTEQAAAARKSLVDKYKKAISDKIRRYVVLPPNMQGNAEAEFDVVLLPDGNPLGVKLKRTSGNTAYDNAVERAIIKAQPLPLPPDPAMFKEFRELNLKFRPQE